MQNLKLAFSAVLFLLLISACTSLPFPSGQWKNEDVKGRNVILFVPGLYGTSLADVESGDRVFLTLGQALWGGIPLALNGEKLGIQNAKNLRADGLLESVSVLPWFFSIDGYGGSILYLQKTFGKSAIVLPFAYDWRENNVKGVKALGKEVRALKEAGAKRIALVGHSLGGALISFYLRYGEQPLEQIKENWEGTRYVDAAVIAGVPYRGTLAAYRDLLYGTKIGFSKTPLTALSLGTFPSYYQFLPPKEDYEELYKIQTWPKWKMGLYSDIENCSPAILNERKKYTEDSLKNALLFTESMRKKPVNSPEKKTPFLAIMGTGQTTLHQYVKNTEWVKKKEGDGLVTVESATPPEAFQKALSYESCSLPLEHRGMFTEKKVQEKVSEFLKRNGF